MRLCAIPECGKVHFCRGWCTKHYARWRKYGDPHKVHIHGEISGELAGVAAAKGPASLVDLAWAAGFLEGDGDFARNREAIRGTQITREPPERLLRILGGRIRESKPTSAGNPVYRWEVSSARCRGVAMTLYPFMSERRQAQIRTMLKCEEA